MKALLFAFVFTFAGQQARAEFMTGNLLLLNMRGNPTDQLYARGYISGVYDASLGSIHCSPVTVNAIQLEDMIRKRLERDPETRELSADVLIMRLLRETWPCRKTAVGTAPNT